MKLTIARFTLELESPMHIGSGLSHPSTDSPVVRDAFGDYRIPGSSLAGALRAATGDDFGAWGDAGSLNSASLIEVSDGFLVDFDGRCALQKRLDGQPVAFRALPEIQDHVRIGHRSGTAEDGGKFDAEIIPKGARFRCEIALSERCATTETDRKCATAAFWRCISLLGDGTIPLGGDVCSGLGIVRILDGSLSVADYDLSSVEGVIEARNRSWSIDDPAVCRLGPIEAPTTPTPLPAAAAGITGRIRLRFRSDGPLLVGGSQRPTPKAGDDKNHGADLVFGETLVADYSRQTLAARPWIPGSSVRGALRHRAWHVLEALGLSQQDSEAQINELFGSVDGDTGRASKVRVHGCFLNDEPRSVVQHVAIDRLTGGSLTGALYTEAPIWRDGLTIDLGLVLDSVSDQHAAVLAHALMDMADGGLPIGGGTRRGNGRLLLDHAEPAKGWKGRAISFELWRDGRFISDKSPPVEIEAFIDHLESANQALAGAIT